MRSTLTLCALLALALCGFQQPGSAQTETDGSHGASAYKMNVSVDEVIVTFHAQDAHGLAIHDLKVTELGITDNGQPQSKIIAFDNFKDHPIRAGILVDTSPSITMNLPVNKRIALQYAQRLLRPETDQAFIMDFGYLSQIEAPWTNQSKSFATGIQKIVAGRENPLGGTALCDTIYRACYSEFGKIGHDASANFILLFSDGEDNSSHTSLQEAVRVCQSTNTAIYAFRPDPSESYSSGPATLSELASETGGRVFHNDESEAQIDNDLRTIEADLRNQYRLIYKPARLKHDGSFHRIQLKTPERVDSVHIRSGYYAPAH